MTNLWSLASAMIRHRHATPEDVLIDGKTNDLVSALDRLAEDDTRPSVALSARADRARVKLLSNISAPDEAFRDLRAVVNESEGLIGYPLEQLSESITQLSDLFVSSAAFEELFETLVSTMARRKGDLAAASMLLQRSAAQLDGGPSLRGDPIRWPCSSAALQTRKPTQYGTSASAVRGGI